MYNYSVFPEFNSPAYMLLEQALERLVPANATVLDIGSGEGFVARFLESSGKNCVVYLLDSNERAFEGLSKDKNLVPCCKEANAFLESDSSLFGLDAIVLQATLHEINDCENQAGYLDNFFRNTKKRLKERGQLIIGDYYFPERLSDQEVERFLKWQKTVIGHRHKRKNFVMPGLLKQKAGENGFEIESFEETRAVKDFDKIYYLAVLRKKD